MLIENKANVEARTAHSGLLISKARAIELGVCYLKSPQLAILGLA